MEIRRFFTSEITGDRVVIGGDEFYHAVRVLRHRPGYRIVVCPGDGYDYYAVITEVGKNSFTAEIASRVKNTAEPAGKVFLFQAVCKELDFVVQKAVELGATDICPMFTERTNETFVSFERLNRVILEAAKQCGRAFLPVLHDAVPFESAVNYSKDFKNRILCYEMEQTNKLSDAIKKNEKDIALYIGSEGGFSLPEIHKAEIAGLEIVSLGKRILRVETAAVAALSLSLSAIGEL